MESLRENRKLLLEVNLEHSIGDSMERRAVRHIVLWEFIDPERKKYILSRAFGRTDLLITNWLWINTVLYFVFPMSSGF